ncbi:hypothetical protein PsorP6_011585 [Peronosclerospora sorghi]|uniref:Uncharacterized protein n=1 Tax=Peronosclerospora sorghi TaxID=230839 RepID=A0ACC0WHS5_9STRA|nr:hypothetical protein PsorP6_011585 [Peronosclerospora sorghi]
MQTKWKQLKQPWRYKTLKDDTAIIFSDAMHKQVHLKPRNRRLDDPLACHNVLAALSTTDLNGILAATSPEKSNQFCKTMVGFMLYSCTPSGRAKLLNLLTKEIINEISIPNRQGRNTASKSKDREDDAVERRSFSLGESVRDKKRRPLSTAATASCIQQANSFLSSSFTRTRCSNASLRAVNSVI